METLSGNYVAVPDDVQLARMQLDVAARLQNVCAGMPPEQFALLVQDICTRKIRWAKDDSPGR